MILRGDPDALIHHGDADDLFGGVHVDRYLLAVAAVLYGVDYEVFECRYQLHSITKHLRVGSACRLECYSGSRCLGLQSSNHFSHEGGDPNSFPFVCASEFDSRQVQEIVHYS